MAKTILKISDDMGAIQKMALNIGREARANGRYTNLPDTLILDSYKDAVKRNLRYLRKKNELRDNRLGTLSRPSNPREWDEATFEEAQEYLAREVWCEAVARYNRANM